MPCAGGTEDTVHVEEMFFMRLGVLRLRRQWIDGLGDEIRGGDASTKVTAAVAVMGAGFAIGFVFGQWLA